MKKLICILVLSINYSWGFAQAIINSGFENWITAPQGWLDPSDWSTSNSTVPGGDSAVIRTTDSYSGSYAAEIQTVTIGFAGLPFAGILVNGSIDFTQVSSIDDLIATGNPITFVPSELNGFYKYTELNAGDSAYVRIVVKKYNSLTAQRDTVAWAEARLAPAASYTAFSIAIDELISGATPDSIVIMFLSKHPDEQMANGVLIVDDISLVDPTGTADLNNSSERITILPNPTAGLITLSGLAQEEFKISVYSILGKLMFDQECAGRTEQKLDLSSFAEGLYFVHVQSGNQVTVKKVIKE